MPNVLTRQQAEALCERALRLITADAAQVRVVARDAGHLRAAVNAITTGGAHTDVTVVLTARIGTKEASIAVNQTDQDALADAAGRVVGAARLAPSNPELMPWPAADPVPAVTAEFQATADLDAAARVQAVGAIVDRAETVGMVGAGYMAHQVTSTAVANSDSLFRYHRSSVAAVSTTVRTKDGRGSGWAGSTHNDWARVVAPDALVDLAMGKAEASAEATAIEPAAYTVVLEPAAVAPLVAHWADALDARAVAEGRSPFARADGSMPIGETIGPESLTLLSDPADPDLLAQPFTDDGQAIGRTVWVERGVLRNLRAERYWASEHGTPPIPDGGGLRLQGTEQRVEDLVSGIARGLLITRLWYIREVDRRTLTYTGLTRDGTFLIENGRITRGVGNLRFNQSLTDMMRRIAAVGRSERTLASAAGDPGPAVVVPPLVVDGFRFTSASDAV